LFRDRTIPSGLPVYENFDTDKHSVEDLVYVQGSRFIGGWDAGQTNNFAFVLLQIVPDGQVQAVWECVAFNSSLDGFAQDVAQLLAKKFPRIARDVDHVGDPAIRTRDMMQGTADILLRKNGFRVMPMTNTWQIRHSNTSELLEGQIDEWTPLFVIDKNECPVLTKALQGAYRYEDKAITKSLIGITSRYKTKPEKDEFSHVADAWQYAAIRAWQYLRRYHNAK
jgi:hypothetical protein